MKPFFSGIPLFIFGLLTNIYSDHVLRSLRSGTDTSTYKIPRGKYDHLKRICYKTSTSFVTLFQTNGLFLKATCNKVRMVHCLYLGVTCYNFQNIVFLSMKTDFVLANSANPAVIHLQLLAYGSWGLTVSHIDGSNCKLMSPEHYFS